MRLEKLIVARVRARGGGVEYDRDVGKPVHGHKTLKAARRRWNAQSRGALESVRLWVDARQRAAGLGKSAPRLAKWLGDIRSYFKEDVVTVIQQDGAMLPITSDAAGYLTGQVMCVDGGLTMC